MKLTITTKQPPASFGEPVFLGDGKVLSSITGLEATMGVLQWTRDDLSRMTGRDRRTIDGWLQGRAIQAASMNVLRDALEEQAARRNVKVPIHQ